MVTLESEVDQDQWPEVQVTTLRGSSRPIRGCFLWRRKCVYCNAVNVPESRSHPGKGEGWLQSRFQSGSSLCSVQSRQRRKRRPDVRHRPGPVEQDPRTDENSVQGLSRG